MKKYTSKLLLFGEHSIIKGSQALAMPLFYFSGNWEYAIENIEEKQMNLPTFANHLEKLKNAKELLFDLDIERFKNELNKGLYFKSNIPTGYGVGSSGALCAAIYDTFCDNKLEKVSANLITLKKIFAQLESFFHGSSSGTDPLICFLEQVILLESTEKIEQINIHQGIGTDEINQGQFFLLDTKMQRETGFFVNTFLKKCKNEYYFARIQSELNPLVDEAITAFLNHERKFLFERIHEIGHFQFKYFLEMIPNDFRTIWLDGLADDLYKLKLCGAGGGGFLLGMTFDFKKTQEMLSSYNLIPINI
ncbi:MAG: mevalonate kinase [Saprospiraceae bacterium]